MEHKLDDLMLADHSITVDTKHFFAIDNPKRIRPRLSIDLTEHSYLPKAGDPRSDWVASVAYPAFLAVQQMDIVRLRPILMTTFAMVAGMAPLVLTGSEGAEQRAPMAHAIIGGVITSTLLTLIVVPVVFTYLDDWATRVKQWFGGRRAVAAA